MKTLIPTSRVAKLSALVENHCTNPADRGYVLIQVKTAEKGKVSKSMAGMLIKAAARGELPDFMRYLIEDLGCDVNEKDENGWDALMYASFFGHLDIVEVLLRYGSDPRARANNGTTALIAALQNGHKSIARLLVEHGADVNALDDAGIPPLMTAAWAGNAEMVGFLISRGACINYRNARGQTALSVAKQKGHVEVIRVLRQAGAIQVEDLFATEKEGDLQKLTFLLQQGLDINARDGSGGTLLMWAALHGHLEVMRYLLQKGALVNARDNCGWTALMSAVTMDHLEIVELLLAHGADPNIAYSEKQMVVPLNPELLLSPEGPRPRDMKALVRMGGPDVEVYETPLMKAAERGSASMVQLLLRYGADPKVKTPRGETAADIAHRKGYREIVEMLEKACSASEHQASEDE